MTTLNLIRVPVNIASLARWVGERGQAVGFHPSVYDEGRGLHHLLVEVFGPGAIQCFRLLVPPRRSSGNLYAYSHMDAQALKTNSALYALPDHLTVLCVDLLEAKPMPESWRTSQHLGFELRVRPVRRLKSNLGADGKIIKGGSEVDAFLLEALQKFPNIPGNMEKSGRTRQVVYTDWLAERTSGIAEINIQETKLSQFRRTKVLRGKKCIDGPDATIHGTLTIVDPTKFSRLLERGIGRHKAYGYGMLLLRPPNKTIPNT